MTSLYYIITIGTVLYYHCTVLVARPTEKSSVPVQLPVFVHRLTCVTLCSFSSLLRAP